MKKTGIILLVAGVLIMGYAGVKFLMQKDKGIEEKVQNENVPFPWLPTVGAIFTAGGIILSGVGRSKKVR